MSKHHLQVDRCAHVTHFYCFSPSEAIRITIKTKEKHQLIISSRIGSHFCGSSPLLDLFFAWHKTATYIHILVILKAIGRRQEAQTQYI